MLYFRYLFADEGLKASIGVVRQGSLATDEMNTVDQSGRASPLWTFELNVEPVNFLVRTGGRGS